MTTRDDVLDAIDHIERTVGAGEATRVAQAALTMPLPPSGYDTVLDRLRAAYPVAGDHQLGRAAQAMQYAEATLAQQLSRTAEFDRKIIEALRHAHTTTLEGRRRLDVLEAEIGAAAGVWDLSTAAGAREFQRLLIAKLGQIIAVVEDANDDDTAKQALAAALTQLYTTEPSERTDPAVSERDPARPDEPAPAVAGDDWLPPADPEVDPYPDPVADDEPWTADPDATRAVPQLSTPMVPGLGSEGPGFGAMPAAIPAGLPLTGLPGLGREDLTDPDDDELGENTAADAADGDPADGDASAPEPGEQGPVTVRLPDGETTTVANSRLAAAMQAVADGQPVVEAFRSQGFHVSPPGTPVAAPIDVAALRPGDIGVFTDRHALAVGDGKALLDGQVHLAENLRGPGFLGWQHPPVGAQEPATPAEPVATRPAAAIGGRMRLKNPAPTGIVD